MDHLAKKLFHMIMMSILAVTINACSPQEKDGDSSGSTGGTSPVDDVPVGNVEETGFWVNLITDKFDVVVQERDNWGGKCFVDKTTTTNTLLICDIDILEGDLFDNDLEIQYNTPPGICDYVRIVPSWNWNRSFGMGPQVVSVEEKGVSGTKVVNDCNASRDGDSSTIPCTSHPELRDISLAGPKCIYDYTDEEGPNCCFGKYTFNYQADTNDDGTPDTWLDPVKRDWGGDVKSCINPYIVQAWDKFDDKLGYPEKVITKVPKDSSNNTVGLNASLVLRSNISTVNYSKFSTAANYFDPSGIHNHDGFYDASVSSLPYSFDPVDDLSGTPINIYGDFANLYPGNAPWNFQCLDAGFEVKHEIHVYIREWNTLADFATYVASEGATYAPNTTGDEGTTCAYDPVFGTNKCNDSKDYWDILDKVGGSYPTTPTTDDGKRVNYFPNIVE